MSTRLYMTSRAPNTNLQGPPLGSWSGGDSTRQNRGSTHWTLLLSDTKTNGGTAVVSNTFGATITAAASQSLIARRWVTPPLQAFTLSGTLNLCIKADRHYGPTSGDTAALKIHVYITAGDTLTQRAVALSNYVDATQLSNIAETWTSLTSAQALTGSGLTGDRIVIELGAECSPDPTNGNGFRIRYGTTDASQVAYADAVAGGTGTGAAWVEFSDTLTLVAGPAAPANDACADATAIASIPYTSAVTDTTASADTDRAVWYTFTPASSGYHFASALGSNYSTDITVSTGSCGSLSAVAGDARVAVSGTGQTVCAWNATSGVPYTIAVTSTFYVTGERATLTAKNSGGSLVLSVFKQTAPQIDDLFVSAQHIACVRDSQILNLTTAFYDTPPTGSAIDDTLRPLADLNGGTDTSLRLYVGLFGTFAPLVEILDLATLNVGEDEIDYLLDAINTGGEDPSSIVFLADGTLVIGFYGNNYAVLGGTPSSADSSAIRYLNATHADNQAGAPWPVADEWQVNLQNMGTNFIDVAVDQDTLYYTSAGTILYRMNLATGAQLGAFAIVPDASGPRPGLRGFRILPPGDGSSGLLVTAGSVVYWLDASGNIIQTYTPSPSNQGQDLDKLEITNDGTKFWAGDGYSGWLFQFDITSGSQLQAVNFNFPPGQFCGLSIYGGYRSSTPPDVPPVPPTPPEPSGALGTLTELPIRWVRRTPVLG